MGNLSFTRKDKPEEPQAKDFAKNLKDATDKIIKRYETEINSCQKDFDSTEEEYKKQQAKLLEAHLGESEGDHLIENPKEIRSQMLTMFITLENLIADIREYKIRVQNLKDFQCNIPLKAVHACKQHLDSEMLDLTNKFKDSAFQDGAQRGAEKQLEEIMSKIKKDDPPN